MIEKEGQTRSGPKRERDRINDRKQEAQQRQRKRRIDDGKAV